jgi:CheY-like chemotaxis protein
VLAKTILFVDDESSILAGHRVVFESLGYSVLTANTGAKALGLLRSHSVDAVVLDYAMNPMNGEETARRVRRKHGNIPIVLFSACLPVPKSVLEVVDICVEKGKGPKVLSEALLRLLQTSPRKRK